MGQGTGLKRRGKSKDYGDHTSAISLHLLSIEVRRSSGKCLRQGAGPGRDRADCSGGPPKLPRASEETVTLRVKGEGSGLGSTGANGPSPSKG